MSIASKKWSLELIWWVVTAVVAALIMLPIVQANIDFPWMIYNVIYIAGAITLLRYNFSLHHHPLSDSKPFKIILILIAPILFFPILEGLHDFLEFNDQEGLQSLVGHLSVKKQSWMMKYMRIEYVLAGTTCFLGVFAMIIKMIRSLWRQVKFAET